MMREFGSTEGEIERMKMITRDDFHPIEMVHAAILRAIGSVREMDESLFEHGKDELLIDLEDIESLLAAVQDRSTKVQFLRA